MVKRFQQKRWWGLAVLAGALALLGLVLARGQARAAKEDAAQAPQTLVITANKVLHSPEELAQELRASGMDEGTVSRVMELETRLDRARDQGLSQDDLRSRFLQWVQELFGPGIEPRSKDADDTGMAPIQPLWWGIHYAPIYASCSNARVRAAWRMPGYRDFQAWFRAYSGNYYWTAGYCPYASCTVTHIASGEVSWDYHAVALPYSWPYWHHAGCY